MSVSTTTDEYILGTSDHELARLRLQHRVWRTVTQRFLDALDLPKGAAVADLGCGPGYVVDMLRDYVGAEGSVLGVDASERWVTHLNALSRKHEWNNVTAIKADILTLEFDSPPDVIFMRWVLAFLPDRDAIVRRLASRLAPGGRLAIMDYNHEGVSLFPGGPGFNAAIQGVRDYYQSRAGDPWVMGDIARLFGQAGLEPDVLEPFVLAGGPDSPAFEWAHAFFPFHTAGMVEAGILTEEARTLFMNEWEAHRVDPHALFFSPIVVGASGRKPA